MRFGKLVISPSRLQTLISKQDGVARYHDYSYDPNQYQRLSEQVVFVQ